MDEQEDADQTKDKETIYEMIDRSDATSLDLKLVPMEDSKDSTSIAESVTSESCSEYSLVDSYDA